MMERDAFNDLCAGFRGAQHVVQWGNADVWKVGGKVFAIAGWNEGRDAYTFKVTRLAYEVLHDQPGIRPAPYLASRGMSWLQVHGDPGLPDAALAEHIRASYDMALARLTRKARAELGIGEVS